MSNSFFEANDLLKDFGIKPINFDQLSFGNHNIPVNPLSKPIDAPQTQQKNYDVRGGYTPNAHISSPYYQTGNINLGNVGKDIKPRAESSNKHVPSSYQFKINDDMSGKSKFVPNNPLIEVPTNPNGYNPNKMSNIGINLDYPTTKLSNVGIGSRSSNIIPNNPLAGVPNYNNQTKESYLKNPISGYNNTKDSYLNYNYNPTNNTPYIPLNQPSQNPDVAKIINDIKRNSGSSTSPNTPLQNNISSPNSVPTPYNNFSNNIGGVGGYTSNTPTPQTKQSISPLNNFQQYGYVQEPIKKPIDNTPYNNNSSPYTPPNYNLNTNSNKASNFSNFNTNANKPEVNLNQPIPPPSQPSKGMLLSSRSTISPFSSSYIKADKPKLDAKYQQSLKMCQQTGAEYTDYEFPANTKSIANPQDLDEYRGVKKWLRPKQIWGNADFELYYKIIEPNDIQQGYLGDCAFLSTIAAIAEIPKRIQKIFINQEKSKYGLYGLNLVWKGVPTEILIDDFIPVDINNKPYFQQSKEKELWAFLMEKAWAKLHKNYHQLNGQLMKESMHDFTGAPIRNFDPRNCDEKQLWQKVLSRKKNGFDKIICAGTLGEDTGDDKDPLKKHGLVSGHAYSLIGAFEITLTNGIKERLVKMRNPWGNFEWNQTFADKDYNWKNVTQEDKDRMEYVNEDDGTFFMKWNTFRQYYDSIDICYYFDDYSYFGVKCRSSYNQAKYFKIEIKKEAFCFFFVSQLTIRCFDEDYQFVSPKDKGHYSETKFCIGDASGNIIQKVKGKKRDLFSPKYVDNEDRQSFKAGTYYVYAQVQWQKNATHSFGLGCYTKDADVKEVSQYEAKCISPYVDKWIQSDPYDAEVEMVYGRV